MKRAWEIAIRCLLLAPTTLANASPARTALVFPFENQSTRPDLNWMGEGFAEILSARLSAGSCYALGREERDEAYAQLGLPPETPLTLASDYKVAETLGVDWAVLGSFRVEGARLTARAQLLEVRTLRLSSPLEATGELADLDVLATRLGWRLLTTHDPKFRTQSEEEFRHRFPYLRLDAFENYIRGILSTDDEARVRFWREADRLSSAGHRAAFALGRFYFDQKDYAHSAAWLGKLDAADTDYLESLFLIAVDEYFLGRVAEAEEALRTLAREIPLGEVSSNLGVMKARRGLYAEALPDFKRAYEDDSADSDFAFNLGACLWYLKKYDEAAKVLADAARQTNDDPEVHTLLAAVYHKLGSTQAENQELDWLAQHGVPAEETRNVASDFVQEWRLKKNYDGRAFRVLSLAVNHALEENLSGVSPARHAEVHLANGRRLKAQGRFPEAEVQLTEAVSLVPGNSEAHLALGQVYEAEGREREAITEFDTVLALKPSSAAHLSLARIHLALGQAEAARSHAQAALELEPNNREATRLIDQISHFTSVSRKTR